MATYTIYSDAADGRLRSHDAVYATARSGAALTASSSEAIVGQELSIGDYRCYEVFLSFDTTGITLPGRVTLSLDGNFDSTTGSDFTAEARLYDWGVAIETGDYVPGASLSPLPLLATWASSGYVTGYNDFISSDTTFSTNINPSGFTSLLLASDRQRIGTSPPSFETVGFEPSETSGTTQDPKLVITTAAASGDDILNPSIDVAINSWTTDTGGTADLYAAIDETTASDTDYIQSPAGPTTAQYYETALETHADPVSSSGHIVHYRYQKNVAGGNVGLTVALVQGAPAPITQTSTSGANTFGGTTGNDAYAQSFLSPGWSLSSVTLSLQKNGAPVDNVVVTLQADASGLPSGTDLVTLGTIAGGSLTTSLADYVVSFTPYPLTGGVSYWIVVKRSGAGDAANTYSVGYINTGGYPNGAMASHAIATGLWSGSISDFRFTASFDAMIASWSHTNIPNSWTQQDQTLTAPQADSITDYSDLRLRFTPDMVTTDQTVPVPTFVADRASANLDTAVTTVDLVLTSLTVGNYLIVRSAADNSGGGGAARSFVVSNQSGTAMGTHTEYQVNNDPGAASAGTTCNVSIIKIAATSGTIRLTYGGSVVQACAVEEWSGINETTPIVGTPVTATQVASGSLLASMTDASIAAGNVAYGVVAVEGSRGDAYTQDADTTNGSWTSLNTVKLGTNDATTFNNQTIYGAYKTVSSAGAQTYNPTIAGARDSAGILLELAAAATPAPTIKAQVSWANLELPAGAIAFPHYAGINLGENWPVNGAISAGATDS